MIGFDLGVLPIGLWSISIILSIYSIPLIFLQSTKPSLLSRSLFTIEEYKTLLINDDLPDPDTPVMHVNRPKGILTSISLRLFANAFEIEIHSLPGRRRSFGTSIIFLPEIKSDV